MEDKRFAHVATDPKFRRIPKGERKVKIDKRFQSMFKDKKFKVKYSVDKRGRPVNHSTTEDLKRYYELSSEDEEQSEDESEVEEESAESPEETNDLPEKEEESNDLKLELKSDKTIPNKVKKKLKNLTVDYARGEAKLISDDSSSDEDEEESEGELSEAEGIDHKWGELDGDAERTEEVTRRLAACNMDWDRIRATDLMVLFNSFLPPGGRIDSVAIYTSEFGKQRLAEEDIKGPIELVEPKNEDATNESEEGSKYHMEKLRQYQLNRLKYFYAVVTCDSPSTANKIYTECDGMEYESSATKIDLRFIPDDMEFEDEAKELCDKIPELNKYKPRYFTTTALQQAKVDLTWDETNPDRIEITQKLASGKVDEVSENDLHAYLASSSGEEEEDEEEEVEDTLDDVKNPIDKYKALLQEIESKEKAKESKDVEMEVSWGIDLEAKTEKLVKKRMEDQENKTPFQQYLDKRKEKRKQKKEARKQNEDSDVPSDIDMNDPYFAEEFNKPEFKKNMKEEKIVSDTEDEDEQRNAELELLLMNEDDGKKHFSLKKIQDQESQTKKKNKKKKKGKDVEDEKEDAFNVNVEDERFSALFTSHHYNIDPTDPHFKKTKGMETLISEKIKRRNKADEGPAVKKLKGASRSAELNVLVKSVKRKAEAFANKK